MQQRRILRIDIPLGRKHLRAKRAAEPQHTHDARGAGEPGVLRGRHVPDIQVRHDRVEGEMRVILLDPLEALLLGERLGRAVEGDELDVDVFLAILRQVVREAHGIVVPGGGVDVVGFANVEEQVDGRAL